MNQYKMKKHLSIMASVLLVVGLMFDACKKDPTNSDVPTDKKISKIYCTTASEKENIRWLSEKWYWNTNGTLKSIDHLDRNGAVQYSMSFVYNGQVLVRVNYDTGDYYSELQYDNGKLKNIRYFSEGLPSDVYTFTYENDKLRTIVHQNNSSVKSQAEEASASVLRLVLPEQVWRLVAASKANQRQGKTTYTTSITLTWNGSNISRMDYVELIEGGYTNERAEEMQYDALKNPYYGCYNGELNLVRCYSKNNMLKLVSWNDGQVGSQTFFEYTYENQYPKKQTVRTEGSTYVLIYEFEYL